MRITLTVCSWGLWTLGIVVTVWLFPLAVAFIPYLLLPFAIMAAHRIATRAVVLVLTLVLVCTAFWYYWDAAYIHISTMNLMPFMIAVVESLVAGLTSVIVYRIERKRVGS
jgi:hypothetical protein